MFKEIFVRLFSKSETIHVTDRHGSQAWWVGGNLHRTDGPAVVYADGRRAWYVNGKRHRTDGPAYISADGTRSWWVNGK